VLSRTRNNASSRAPGTPENEGKLFKGYTYLYEIIDKKGSQKTGQLTSPSLREAIRTLERMATTIVRLERITVEDDVAAVKVRERQLVIFFRALAQLVKSGIPILRSLEVLGTQAEDRKLGIVVAHLRRSISNGAPFSQALGSFPHIFSKFRRSIIKAGEEGGTLDDSLVYLAGIAEKEQQLRNKVISALTYPMSVIAVAIIAGLLLLKWLYPSLRVMISDLGLHLPVYSRCIIFILDNIGRLYVIIPVALVLILAAQRLRRYIFDTMEGRIWWERCVFKIPAAGWLLKKSIVIHVIFTLAALMKAGIQLSRALELASETCDSVMIGQAIDNISTSVGNGRSLAESMRAHSDLFPAALIAMVEVGEESGSLVKMMNSIIRLYDTELDSALEVFTSLIEPLVILALGVAAGIMIVVLFLPVYMSLQRIT
jgi:type IV pilus assembly protein PilC